MSAPHWTLREPDELEVEMVLAGEIPASRVHPVERAEAVRRLLEKGQTRTEIAARIGLTPDSVNRWRRIIGLAPPQRRPRVCTHGEAEISVHADGRRRCRACKREDHRTRGLA